MSGAAGQSPKLAGATQPESTAESERMLLLECRLEKVCSALDEARADADVLRSSLAEAAAREADHARRFSAVHQELAEARADIASLHERLSRSEALRAELEGHLFEAGARGDAAELVRLRRELLSQRERFLTNEHSAARLRARVDELLLSRETLLTRVAEWQLMVQKEDPEAIDLGEFIAELRREILSLEQRNAASERVEVALRERLARAGVDPGSSVEDEFSSRAATAAPVLPRSAPYAPRAKPVLPAEKAPVTDSFESSLSSAAAPISVRQPVESVAPVANGDRTAHPIDADPPTGPDSQDDVTILPVIAADAASLPPEPEPSHRPLVSDPVEGLSSLDPSVRAAAYERLTRVFEGSPSLLADYLRSGLSDPDPRVRRRTVLAAATARRLSLRPLLEPLRGDSDPHVRRVVREVLRHAQESGINAYDTEERAAQMKDRIRAVPPNRSHFRE